MNASAQTVYDFSADLLDGQLLSLSYFKGHVLLIVNTASKCGFTPQYAGLEELYQRYRERGLVVLGFPCNQFGAQEPGNAQQIGQFCQRNYGVSFPMFAKVDVNGPQAHPLYRYLKSQKRGWLGMQRIQWNFTKFVVNRAGHVVKRHAPATDPRTLTAEIEQLLAE